MDCVTDPRVETVTLMKSARTGGTEALINNVIGYFIDQDPGPMMVVQPTLITARKWSKKHFDPMVRSADCLRVKVSSDKIKDRRNEILEKEFPGGMLTIVGANSAVGFRQETIKRALLDDTDGYPPSAGNEGDPIELARTRTVTYSGFDRKIIEVSTPTVRELSRIEDEFYRSDQCHYHLPCPFCRFLQLVLFSPRSQFAELSRTFIKFDPENPRHSWIECANCKKIIEERYRIQMIRQGKWIPQRPQIVTHRGFHISEVISPFSSWGELSEDFLKANKATETLRTFVNTRLGETFEENRSFGLKDDDLLKRVEDYTKVPNGVLVLTASVDVQHNRLEVKIKGWGRNFESWLIDVREIIGSPERESTWKELDELLAKEWEHESGLILKPWTTNGLACVTVDSGDSTEIVYKYVKKHQTRRYYAVKGDDGFAKSFIISTKYIGKQRARFALLGVDAIKVRLFDRLNLQKDKDGKFPPGYMHFNQQADRAYFDQLTAEKRILIPDRRTGRKRWIWKTRPGKDNHKLDLEVYNVGAITLLQPNFDKLAEHLDERINELKAQKESGGVVEQIVPDEEQQQVKHPRRRRGRGGRGWVNSWRR